MDGKGTSLRPTSPHQPLHGSGLVHVLRDCFVLNIYTHEFRPYTPLPVRTPTIVVPNETLNSRRLLCPSPVHNDRVLSRVEEDGIDTSRTPTTGEGTTRPTGRRLDSPSPGRQTDIVTPGPTRTFGPPPTVARVHVVPTNHSEVPVLGRIP